MKRYYNELGQPIGFPLPQWRACPHPRGARMQGRLCRLEPIDAAAHAADLYESFGRDREGRDWTYLPYGPFGSATELRQWIERYCVGDDPCFYAIVDVGSGRAMGVASYLRIEPEIGVIEVGHIHFSPLIQVLPIASEAMYLMMRQVFDAWGYRRYEWKCDAMNQPSRAAAERLGFLYEGLFRQATMYKGRNRDTAWYSILDREWPAAKSAFESWLEPDNFDADGLQKSSLSATMRTALAPLRKN